MKRFNEPAQFDGTLAATLYTPCVSAAPNVLAQWSGETMNNLYARAVFFVKDAERSLSFYTEQLGFSVDWKYPEEGPAYVFQVSLFGFELILNQVPSQTRTQAGNGRVFIGLEDDQIEPVRKHIEATGIKTERLDWGQPTLAVRDLDDNELFFWDWPNKVTPAVESSEITEPVR